MIVLLSSMIHVKLGAIKRVSFEAKKKNHSSYEFFMFLSSLIDKKTMHLLIREKL
jgi:hypothetical protein